jgi:endonuclease III
MFKLPSFSAIISKLETHYGKPRVAKTTDPLGLIIHENIAYLVSDEKRDATFETLRKRVGLKPTEILAVPIEDLVEITRLGGIHPETRAARLKEIAQIVLNDFAGDLNNAQAATTSGKEGFTKVSFHWCAWRRENTSVYQDTSGARS